MYAAPTKFEIDYTDHFMKLCAPLPRISLAPKEGLEACTLWIKTSTAVLLTSELKEILKFEHYANLIWLQVDPRLSEHL